MRHVAKTLLAALTVLHVTTAFPAFGHFAENVSESGVIGNMPINLTRRIFANLTHKRKTNLHLIQTDFAGFNVYSASGEPGAAIPLTVILPISLPKDYTFLMIRGIPSNFQISVGFKAKDAWVLSLQDAKALTITSPANFEGTIPLEVLLTRGNDVNTEARQISLTVRAPRQPEAATAKVQTSPGSSENDPQRKSLAVPAEEEQALLTGGASILKQGNVSAARIMFEELATRGSAKGALALAQTYDPVILKATMISGIKPDLAKAQFWYEKAQSLGNPDAEKRLADIRAGR